ncbi:hypothetical protein CHH57_01455 [Niallia circulans]|uniref:SGNH hydrolase-type esterase domain-containing protein n=1 Tax=Niallia circulans TaxID=1397 RepID=A0AA91TVZ4_NIACI|nr:GDSL-type esterase/lipase family protein [Niallia circulans]PAD85005.1 hypothetical protein CHH57_01455 [Niallia circulans]
MKIVSCGDSITQGLGVSDHSYIDLIAQKFNNIANLETELFNFAGSAMQIKESAYKLEDIISLNPNYVFVMHGITESIVRPTNNSLKFMPKKYRKIGWLDPRPYFSSKLFKCKYQKIESALRWRVKNKLIEYDGGMQLTPLEDFKIYFSQFIESLVNNTKADIILVSHCGIDERYYPCSLSSLEKYKGWIFDYSTKFENRIKLVDISILLNKWDDYFSDHFHPNQSGHEKIADYIYDTISLQSLDLVTNL